MSSEYPKLHLPPYFEKEVGDETLKIKQWFGAAFVELEDGSFVQPHFISLERIGWDITESGFYLADGDTVILTEFSLDRIKQVLPELASKGAFNFMTKYSAAEWE